MTAAALVLSAAVTSRAEESFVGDDRVHVALWEGATDRALGLLQENPALIESRSRLEETPLHVAAQAGQGEVIRWLLAHGAKVNAIAYNGYTPLHLVEDGDIARALIAGGSDLNQKDTWGNTSLQMAAEEGRHEVVDAILAAGYRLDLRTAVILRRRDAVKQLLRDDPASAKEPTHGSGLAGSNTPLGIACGQGDLEIVVALLDGGADVNEGTFMPTAGSATALTNAVWAGHAEIVELLLKRGADSGVTGGKWYPSISDYARAHSSLEIIRLLEQPRGSWGPTQRSIPATP